MSDNLEPDECPSCGDYRNIDVINGEMNHVETIEHVDGGTNDFLQTWERFHCDSCDTQIAVLESEVCLDD